MFEPIHGSAFDIPGKNIAKPVAAFWTAAQVLDHLGEQALQTFTSANSLARKAESLNGRCLRFARGAANHRNDASLLRQPPVFEL